jgi:hypothetical protein
MSSAKKKKDSNQPELPIEGVKPAPADAKPARKSTDANGNGAQHVVTEAVEAMAHRPFDPKKLGFGLHTRVNRGLLEYASHVIRERAIPNLADGLQPVLRRILWALHEQDDGRSLVPGASADTETPINSAATPQLPAATKGPVALRPGQCPDAIPGSPGLVSQASRSKAVATANFL